MLQLRASNRWLSSWAAVFCTMLVVYGAHADAVVVDLHEAAERAEKAGLWDKARDSYAQLLAKDRTHVEYRKRFQRCHRLAILVQRHRDPSYREQLAEQDLRTSFLIYREILNKLRGHYVDPEKTDLTRVFHNGLDELRLALGNDIFRQERLSPIISITSVQALSQQLKDQWDGRLIQNQRELETEITRIAQTARNAIGLEPVVTVFEFACGACHGLDEHTLYLTPSQLAEVYASLEGERAGVGIDVTIRGGKVLVSRIQMGSPAARAGIEAGDQITHVDGKAITDPSEEMLDEVLHGEDGSSVELKIHREGAPLQEGITLARETTRTPSVTQAQILPEQPGVGYFQITNFHKNTAHELDDALMRLEMLGMKVLIVDIRGNPGGYLPAAIQVAERFLPEGKVIVTTESHVPEHVRVYKASHAGALQLPLVVLVDNETASAAEVVAGALHSHHRATLVGEPTFGKWSVQRVLELKSARSGVRVTLARFLSPGSAPYTVKGVTPDLVVERSPISMADNQLLVAIQVALRLVEMRP